MYYWKLKDVILISIISVLFSIVFLATVYFSIFLTSVLTPFGIGPLANEFVFGIWFMAGTFAPYIMRKPGVAVVSETMAATIQVLMGNPFGPLVIVSGFLQGVGAELGFMAFKYKRYDWISMFLASIGSTILSFIWGFYRSGFFNISWEFLAIMFIVRTVSALIFSGVISKILADKLAKAGALKSYPIGESFKGNMYE